LATTFVFPFYTRTCKHNPVPVNGKFEAVSITLLKV